MVAVGVAGVLLVGFGALGVAAEGHGLAAERGRRLAFLGVVATGRRLVAPAALGRGVSGLVAGAAVGRGRLGLAVRGLFADQGALGLLAVGGAMALPVAERLLADGLAGGLCVVREDAADGVCGEGVVVVVLVVGVGQGVSASGGPSIGGFRSTFTARQHTKIRAPGRAEGLAR